MNKLFLKLLSVTLCFCQFFIPQRIAIQKNHCTVITIDSYWISKSIYISFLQTDKISTFPINFSFQSCLQIPSEGTKTCIVKVCTKNITNEQILALTYYILTRGNASINTNSSDNYIILDIDDFGLPTTNISIQEFQVDQGCAQITVDCPSDTGAIHYLIGLKQVKFPDKVDLNYFAQLEDQVKAVKKRAYEYSQNPKSLNQPQSAIVIGKITVSSKKTVISISEFSSATFKICLIYENPEIESFSNALCQNFQFKNNMNVSRLYFNFTQAIDLLKLNYLLCFLVDFLEQRISNIQSINGYTCNIEGQNSSYIWNIPQVPWQSKDIIIYVFQNCNYTKSQLLFSKYGKIFNESKQFTKSGKKLFSQNKIDWIKNGRIVQQKTFNQIISLTPNKENYKIIAETQQKINQSLKISIEAQFFGTFFICVVPKETKNISSVSISNRYFGEKLSFLFCNWLLLTKLSPSVYLCVIQRSTLILEFNQSFRQSSKIYYTISSENPEYLTFYNKYHQLVLQKSEGDTKQFIVSIRDYTDKSQSMNEKNNQLVENRSKNPEEYENKSNQHIKKYANYGILTGCIFISLFLIM